MKILSAIIAVVIALLIKGAIDTFKSPYREIAVIGLIIIAVWIAKTFFA